ncbi:MAG: phosphatase [Hyphomicrobiales bacterium]|nr:MAG: phosphatase [Hyphomicrobiales bacterium]
MSSKIHAVIFDMDGLLLDTERVYLEGLRQTRAAFDLDLNDELFFSLIGLDREKTEIKLAAGLEEHVDFDAFNKEWRQRTEVLFMQPIPIKPGVHDLLDRLQSLKMPYAIATATKTEKAQHHLTLTGLIDLFPIVIGGDQVENGKPAPDIYLKAAAALNIEPHLCAAFEDSDTGTRAAVAAGTRTVQVPDLISPSPEVVALKHHIATDLISGARHLGLMEMAHS